MTTPTWLNPAKEIIGSDQPSWFVSLDDKRKAASFIKLCMTSLKSSGLTPEQRLEVTANMISETGWGRKWKGFNFGGWKITKDYCTSYKAEHGTDPLWWQAAGHVLSGDQPVVYYRGYNTADEFLSQWVKKFVPKVSDTTHRYHKTGIAFWQESPSWFLELCLAGYKGPVTERRPGPSVAAFHMIVERARIIYTQQLLGVVPDAKWGPASKLACKTYQENHQITPTGIVDQQTFLSICSTNEGSV